jgi:actin-related protein
MASRHTVVIELGSSLVRVGFAGEAIPRFITTIDKFPTFTEKAEYRGELNIGKVRKLYTDFFHLLFLEYLQVKSRDYKILIVEKFYTPRIDRNCMVTSLLKDLQVISVSMQPDLLLPLLTAGMKSGLIIDLGETECRVIAIAYGRAVMHSYRMTPIGIKNAANNFSRQIKKLLNHDIDSNISSNEQSRALFEKVADLSENVSSIKVSSLSSLSKEEFILPSALRQKCLSLIVSGTTAAEDDDNDDEVGGCSGLLLECLRSLDTDLRAVAAGYR